jgi:ABC-type nitrate/sulfonate/bicarbonate transport system substrate-binding protein
MMINVLQKIIHRKYFPLIVIPTVLALLAALLILTKPAEKKDHVVKVGYLPMLGSASYDVAKENQYFEKEGIQYDVVQIQTANQLLEAFVRGEVDVTPIMSIIPILTSEEVSSRKVEIFSVGDYSLDQPFDSIIVNKESKIQTVKELEGKKIGVFPGSTATNLLKKYFSDTGIDVSKIEFMQIAAQTQLTALYSGSIDALHSFEPNTTIASVSGKTRPIFGSVYATQFNHAPVGAGVISKDFVRKYPSLAKKVVDIFNKANDVIQNDPTSVRPIIAKAFKLDQNIANTVVLVRSVDSSKMDKNVFMQYVSLLVSAGELTSIPNTSGLFFESK